jgi:hypothetical protein
MHHTILHIKMQQKFSSLFAQCIIIHTILHIKMQQKFSSLFAQCIIIHNVLYHELYCTCINDCWAAIRNKKKPHNRLSREFLKFIIVNLKQNQRPNFDTGITTILLNIEKKFKWPIKNRRFFYWFCSGTQRYFKVFWKDQDPHGSSKIQITAQHRYRPIT